MTDLLTPPPVVAVPPAPAPAAPDLSATAPRPRAMSADYDTFLRMLTVQMRHQDPLNPIDSTDYAVQLATFSGVEQQVRTNDLLAGLAGQMAAQGLGQMAAWVGREARVEGPVAVDGAPVTLDLAWPEGATRAELVVTDASGAEVDRRLLPTGTRGPVEWVGATADGMPFPPGTYAFAVEAFASEAPTGRTPVPAYARVDAVGLEDGALVLTLRGGARVPATSVTGLRG